VTSNPAGINCPTDCSETYTQNQIVNLTPTPDAGYVFSGWSGDSDCSDGIITMNSNKTCNAIFVSSGSGSGGSGSGSGGGSGGSGSGLGGSSGDSGSGSVGSDNDLSGLLLFLINKKKNQCFIATATYGTPMAEEVQILRDFRDKYLITNLPGQIFVYLYYEISPPIAKLIENNETLKTISRIVLTSIIYSIKYPTLALFLFSSSFLGLFLSFLINKKYRKQ
jgi:hypothetical protein